MLVAFPAKANIGLRSVKIRKSDLLHDKTNTNSQLENIEHTLTFKHFRRTYN
jgi:hypothetical protein